MPVMKDENLEILLVEDSIADQRLFEILLKPTNLSVNELWISSTLNKALEQLNHNKIDIVLLDLSLPDSSGFDGLKTIKQLHPNIPIVILTGLDDKKIATKAISLGAQDYIYKGDYSSSLIEKAILYAVHRHTIHYEVTQMNKLLDSYVYSVSHDLRGPVINLRLLINLYHETQGTPEQPDILKHMEASILKLNLILDNLNDVLVEKKSLNDVSYVNFDEVFREVTKSLNQEIEETNAVITSDFSCAEGIGFTRSQIYSVMYNLIYNAIKYRKPEVPPEVNVSTKSEDSFIHLLIQDNGLGIEPKYHEKIFDMFYRNNTSSEGKGIGLHIVKTVSENSGGYVKEIGRAHV